MTEIQKCLFAMKDDGYKEFQCKLMPTVQRERVIGVRTPALRQYAKELAGSEMALTFLKELPHPYYEEDNLHGFFIEKIGDFHACVSALECFLPYVDNWATCDSVNPPVFKKHHNELLKKCRQWLRSEHTYVARFGIKCLMNYFLDEHFRPEYLELVASVRSEEYYIKMMVAWYFATALAKQYDFSVIYLAEQRLPKWVHNKTIQKAVESYRISPDKKAYLKTLRL